MLSSFRLLSQVHWWGGGYQCTYIANIVISTFSRCFPFGTELPPDHPEWSIWHVAIHPTKKKVLFFCGVFWQTRLCEDGAFFTRLQWCAGVFWQSALWLMGLSVQCILLHCRGDKSDILADQRRSFWLVIFLPEQGDVSSNKMFWILVHCLCLCVYKAVPFRRHSSEWRWCLPKPWRVGRVSTQHTHICSLHYYTLITFKCLIRPPI